MNKDNLQLGIITEDQLVNIFGNGNQKRKYLEYGKFTSSYKAAVLKEANRFGAVIDIGNRQYDIKEIHRFPKSKAFAKMQKGLYKYIVPLILNKLIEGHDENNKIELTYNKWAKQIEMINGNYALIKNNIELICDLEDDYFQKNNDLRDFFSRVDNMITNYLQNSLKYLQESGAIIWREVYRIQYEKVNRKSIELDETGKIRMSKSIDNHQATDKEFKIYTKCVAIADRVAGIKKDNEYERYYSSKSKDFHSVLTKELWKYNIRRFYKTYEAYYLDLDKCKYLLQEFNVGDNIDTFIEMFNMEFKTLIMNNAITRHNTAYDDLIIRYTEEYINTFLSLCNITINYNAEDIKEKYSLPDKRDYYELEIYNIKEI